MGFLQPTSEDLTNTTKGRDIRRIPKQEDKRLYYITNLNIP
jgi:hypothetical protein